MSGKPKTGGSDGMLPPGRRGPLGIKKCPPGVPKTGPSRGATLLSCIYDINVMFFYDWAGAMQSGASWAVLFTTGVTSYAAISFEGYGFRRDKSFARLPSPGSSQ